MDVMGQRRANPHLLVLRSHNSYHRELLPYSKLMGWLRDVDAQQYVDLYKVKRHSPPFGVSLDALCVILGVRQLSR